MSLSAMSDSEKKVNFMYSELGQKIKASIERLKAFEPPEGYYLAFSGGKDSVVCKALLDISGCKYDATYRITSVDPPELVQFIKTQHPDVKREYPRYSDGTVATMWNLIPRKLMPPTRVVRYCCQVLKEGGGDGRLAVTGVRWAESYARRHNQGVITIASKRAAKSLDKDHFTVTKSGGGGWSFLPMTMMSLVAWLNNATCATRL